MLRRKEIATYTRRHRPPRLFTMPSTALWVVHQGPASTVSLPFLTRRSGCATGRVRYTRPPMLLQAPCPCQPHRSLALSNAKDLVGLDLEIGLIGEAGIRGGGLASVVPPGGAKGTMNQSRVSFVLKRGRPWARGVYSLDVQIGVLQRHLDVGRACAVGRQQPGSNSAGRLLVVEQGAESVRRAHAGAATTSLESRPRGFALRGVLSRDVEV